MALYADIIIDISLEKLDRTFQYLVPEELEQDIGIGMPIEVPFGKGSRRITGYVVNLTTEPSFDPAKIKPIFNIKTDGIPIEAELISLAAWMRKNYGGTMNQALKTVLPIKRKENEKPQKKRGRGSSHTDFGGLSGPKTVGEKLIHSGASTAGSRTAGQRRCAVQAFCTAKPWRKGGFISPAQVKMRGPRKIHDFVGRTRWRLR